MKTLWDAMLALPQGHQHLGLKDDDDFGLYESAGFTLGTLTRYGACLRPYQDHAVVTYVLGSRLERGDEIVAIDGKRGEELQKWLVSQPAGSGVLPPTDAGRVARAVRAFFSVDRAGTVLTVRHAGKAEEKQLTLAKAAPIAEGFGCDDAFLRDYTKPAIGTLLPDGTGVLYIPEFAQLSVDAFESEVGPEFDKVKSAPRLVIDLRGNGGGLLKSALDLVSQFPGAKRVDYCEFFVRTPKTSPPTYASKTVYAVEPPSTPGRFEYHGKVALLVDGGTHSASEHLVLAAKTATSVIVVGTKTAGAYGSITNDKTLTLPGKPTLEVSINRSQVRAINGAFLDGTSMTPDVEVEYEPAPIAAGRDPMLDRAVAELSK